MNLSWTYDRYGNRWDQNLSGSGQIGQPHFTFNGTNNVVNTIVYTVYISRIFSTATCSMTVTTHTPMTRRTGSLL